MTSPNLDFFNDRALKYPDAPCHYLDKWVDKYAFSMRSNVLCKNFSFMGKSVFDAGGGDCRYAELALKQGARYAYVMDQSYELLRIGSLRLDRGNYRQDQKWTYLCNSLDKYVPLENTFDAAMMNTVFQCIAPDVRAAAMRNVCSYLKPNGCLLLLDYFPNVVPEYQKNKSYKWVFPLSKTLRMLRHTGFFDVSIIPINFIDVFLFYKFGSSFFIYLASILLDKWFVRAIPAQFHKYRLILCKRC